MTYTGINAAELKTLHQFAEVRSFELMELNGSLITLITETEEANGQDAWPNIDLDNAGDDCRCWYPL